VANGSLVSLGATNSLILDHNFTISTWFKDPSVSNFQTIYGNSPSSLGTALDTGYSPGGAPRGWNFGYSAWGYGTGTITSNTWTMVTMSVDSSYHASYYLNGASAGTGTDPEYFTQTTGALTLGGNAAMTFDQAEVSTGSARSADWIKTEYNNQCSPSTFYAYGALGANGRQSSSGAAVPAVRVRGGVKFH
jgi:hypothetical protein